MTQAGEKMLQHEVSLYQGAQEKASALDADVAAIDATIAAKQKQPKR